MIPNINAYLKYGLIRTLVILFLYLNIKLKINEPKHANIVLITKYFLLKNNNNDKKDVKITLGNISPVFIIPKSDANVSKFIFFKSFLKFNFKITKIIIVCKVAYNDHSSLSKKLIINFIY